MITPDDRLEAMNFVEFEFDDWAAFAFASGELIGIKTTARIRKAYTGFRRVLRDGIERGDAKRIEQALGYRRHWLGERRRAH